MRASGLHGLHHARVRASTQEERRAGLPREDRPLAEGAGRVPGCDGPGAGRLAQRSQNRVVLVSVPLTKRERKLKRKLKRVTSAREVTSAPMFMQGDRIYIPQTKTTLL